MLLRKRLSVATYVVVLLVSMVTLLLTLVGFAGYHAYRGQEEADLERRVNVAADQLAAAIALAVWNIDHDQIRKTMESTMQDRKVQGVVIKTEDRVYALTRDEQRNVRPADPARLEVSGLIRQERAVILKDAPIGRAILYVTPMFMHDKLNATLGVFIGAVLLLDVFLVLGVYWFLWRIVLKPLRQVEAYAISVSTGRRDDMAMDSRMFIGEFESLRGSIEKMVALLESRYQELRVSTERFWQLVRGFPYALGLYVTDTGRLTFLNSKFTELFGYTQEDIPDTGTWFAKAYPDADYRKTVIDIWAREMEVALKHGSEVKTLEYTVTCKDGSVKIVEIGGVPSGDYVLGILNDVTERKRAEAELQNYHEHLEELVEQRTEELRLARDIAETANRSKSVFLANMSHELRTPLNSVIGFAQLMAKAPQISEEQKRNLEIISYSGSHLLTLINDILELSKIEAGKMALNEDVTDLGRLLREVLDMLRTRAQDAGLSLTLEAHDLPRAVIIDAAKLRQVLLNLLSNATKFTQAGTVTLAVNADVVGDIATLRFAVTDTGIGISVADQQRIFEPFVQTESFTKPSGTGLGLAISRQYVDMLGGRLSVASAPDQGATFSFTITARVGVAEPPSVGERRGCVVALADPQHARRILVADDGADARLLLREALEPFGFEIIEARDGIAAEELIETQRPDLALMDWRMPQRDGLEVTRRIRARPDLRHTKIIVVTANAFEENRLEALEAGADDFMRKPVDAEQLYSLLEKHLGIRFEREGDINAPRQTMHGTLSAADLDALAPELRERLVAAVSELNPVRIGEVLTTIREQHAALADRLGMMVSAMQYRQLWQLLRIVE